MDPEDTAIFVDICDQQLVLHQSRKSFNCGSTLWSAGLVLARLVQSKEGPTWKLFKNPFSVV